jgi:acetyl esterase/lipase
MDSTLILVKTAKGLEEIRSRAHGLPQQLRALLIMADGSLSISTLLSRTAHTPQAEESIAWLVREGFVEAVPGKRPTPAAPANGALPPRQMLLAMTRELLGPDAARVLQKLKDAPDSPTELAAAVDRCHKFIKLTLDEQKAAQFLQMARALLNETRA